MKNTLKRNTPKLKSMLFTMIMLMMSLSNFVSAMYTKKNVQEELMTIKQSFDTHYGMHSMKSVDDFLDQKKQIQTRVEKTKKLSGLKLQNIKDDYYYKLDKHFLEYYDLKDHLKNTYDEIFSFENEVLKTENEKKVRKFFRKTPELFLETELKHYLFTNFHVSAEGGSGQVDLHTVPGLAIKRYEIPESLDGNIFYYLSNQKETILSMIMYIHYPNIAVPTYGYFYYENVIFIIMENCGMNLSEYTKSPEYKLLSHNSHEYEKNFADPFFVFSQKTLEAFEELHLNHHDITPRNILVDAVNNKFFVFDWGLGSFYEFDTFQYDFLSYTGDQPTTPVYGHPFKWAVWRKWDDGSFEHFPDMIQRFHKGKDSYAFGMIFLRLFHLADNTLMTPTQFFATDEQSFITKNQELKLYLAGIDNTMKSFYSVGLQINDIGKFIIKTVIDEWKYFATNDLIKGFYDECNDVYTKHLEVIEQEVTDFVTKLSNKQLKEECYSRGLSQNDKKQKLQNRLVKYEKKQKKFKKGDVVKFKWYDNWRFGLMKNIKNEQLEICVGYEKNEPLFKVADYSFTDQITLTFLE